MEPATRADIPRQELWPIVTWTAAQVAALAAVDAWQRAARPGEMQAIGVLVAIEFLVAAGIFPALLSNWLGAAVALATAAPFVAMATKVDGGTMREFAWWLGGLAAWLAALWSWAILLKSQSNRAAAVAVSLVLLPGTAVAAYLFAEFGGGAAGALSNPIVSGILHFPPRAFFWVFPAIFLGIGIACLFLIRRGERRHPRK